jgi:DNA-binding MarR family transcriptional regulator
MQPMAKQEHSPGGQASFLLAQVGAHAAQRFGERLKPLGFVPYHAGLLRKPAKSPGMSQQELAKVLRMHASHLVGIVDELEERGLVERKPSVSDRRVHALHLTPEGLKNLGKIGEAAREHHRALLAALNDVQQTELAKLLEAVAEEQGLTAGVHPGYAKMGRGSLRARGV